MSRDLRQEISCWPPIVLKFLIFSSRDLSVDEVSTLISEFDGWSELDGLERATFFLYRDKYDLAMTPTIQDFLLRMLVSTTAISPRLILRMLIRPGFSVQVH